MHRPTSAFCANIAVSVTNIFGFVLQLLACYRLPDASLRSNCAVSGLASCLVPLPFCLIVVGTFMQGYSSTLEEALYYSLGVTFRILSTFTSRVHATAAGAVSCQELPASYTMCCEPFWQRPCLCNASGEACMKGVHTPQRSCSTP